ncbi:hypothetical protein [[Clostridium] colinum]|uniref:hypothetical protein n=1 Tax=[Clostridium] colinum TaxID=36835 RepID=UPI0020258841|nr:hypothetical protein [[Clostridium] colinum]
MIYTREIIKNIIKSMKNELHKTSIIIVLNDRNEIAREGKFISLNKRYIKIRSRKHGIHKINITDIKNISAVVTE